MWDLDAGNVGRVSRWKDPGENNLFCAHAMLRLCKPMELDFSQAKPQPSHAGADASHECHDMMR